jgi:ATP-dependent DNA ligase
MPLGFIAPCLPTKAKQPPSGERWLHEIKHDGCRLMARRDPVGIRLITRRGNDWTDRYPLVVEAVNHLKIRSCLIEGEAVCRDETGLAVFQKLRQRREEHRDFSSPSICWSWTTQPCGGEPIEETDATDADGTAGLAAADQGDGFRVIA